MGAAMFDYMSIQAVAIAWFLHMFMGAMWYHPRFFGTAFIRLAHGGKQPKPDIRALQVAALGTLIAMPFFSLMLSLVGCQSAGEGALWGFSFGFFLDGGLNVSHSFFENRPFALFVLHRAYHIVSLSLVGAVLAAVCSPAP